MFGTLTEAKVLLEDWRIDYNWNRPHSTQGNVQPAKYAATQKPTRTNERNWHHKQGHLSQTLRSPTAIPARSSLSARNGWPNAGSSPWASMSALMTRASSKSRLLIGRFSQES